VGSQNSSGNYHLSFYIYDNIPYVAYSDSTNSNKLTVKRFNGLSWDVVGVAGVSNGTAEYISMSIYNNIIYVGYGDVSDSNKVTVVKFAPNL
jgi:hypothetical protein